MIKTKCQYPDCDLDVTKDEINLERINPKGEPFEGMCPEHYRKWIQDSFEQFAKENL